MEGYIVDSAEKSQAESFLSMPRFEVAFSTSTDVHGPIFHINSHARSLLLQYSLYNHFAMGMAIMVIRETFLDDAQEQEKPKSKPAKSGSLQVPMRLNSIEEIARHEVTTVDFKANLLQVKANMPADPPMMVQFFDVSTGVHRYGTPFARCNLGRL